MIQALQSYFRSTSVNTAQSHETFLTVCCHMMQPSTIWYLGVSTHPPRHTHPKEYAPLPWTTWHPDIPTHPTRDMRPGIPTRWEGPGTSYTHSPLPREQTDTCENIIFPQLPLVGGRHALSNTLLT